MKVKKILQGCSGGVFFLLLMMCSDLHAQVTVGSDLAPVSGALLDLKEKDDSNGVTSTKGLNLPRVQLHKSNRTNLKDIQGVNNQPIEDVSQYLVHIGLTVYNIGGTGNDDLSPDGIYVWKGQTEGWVYLGCIR